MASKTMWIASAAIVVVASAALLAPTIASGVPTAPGFSLVADTGKHADGPGNNGQGNAWGHHKDSDDFPGNNGRGNGQGKDKGDKDDKQSDGPGNNGQGNAWGHHKDSENFPGNNGRGDSDDDD